MTTPYYTDYTPYNLTNFTVVQISITVVESSFTIVQSSVTVIQSSVTVVQSSVGITSLFKVAKLRMFELLKFGDTCLEFEMRL